MNQRYARLFNKGANIRDFEAVDLALDELTRNPQRIGTPQVLAIYALKSAYKKLGWREKYHERNATEDVAESLDRDTGHCCTDEALYEMIEIEDFINRSSSLNAKDKELIGYLYNGMNVNEIAFVKGKSKKVTAVCVTRARKRFKSAWEDVV